MKVGKAIYNILSQSTDVQSNFPFNTTDYSPTGTELVTNGDFSAAGSNLITNPNFTDTGSEEVVDGDFPIGTTEWNVTGSVTFAGAGAYFDIADGAFTKCSQDIVYTSGTSYKVTFDLTGDGSTNDVKITDDGSALGGLVELLELSTVTPTTHTFYFVANANSDTIYFKRNQSSGDYSFTIDNVSVKELGEDWTIGGTQDSTHYVEFIETGARFVLASTSPLIELKQTTFQLLANKSYKLTVDMTRVSGSVKVDTSGVSELFDATTSGTNNTRYITPTANMYLSFYRQSTPTDITFHSVSVQELGEGWTLGTGASIGEDKLVVNGGSGFVAYQGAIVNSTANYKISFLVSNYVSGNILGRVSNVNGNVTFTGDGLKTDYIQGSSGTNVGVYCTGGFIGDVTSITVEEMVLNKIFPELAPPDIDAPYVVYSVVSNSPSDTKNANGDIDTASIEVYGFQDTYNKAVDLGVSIRAALDRKTGTYNTIEIQSTNYVNEQMDVNEARKLWAAIQDYSIRIKNL